MAHVAFVGVALFALAALHGAKALHLTAVEEGLGFRVVELHGFRQVQVAIGMQALDKVGRKRVVNFARATKPAAFVDV